MVSAFRVYTRVRESRGPMTSKDGFSVVAPIKTMFPRSTCGRKASCWALLKRWISSIKTMVRRPSARALSAVVMTSLISLIPESTALNGMKSLAVIRAMIRARVVFPEPGGPQRISDVSSSFSICTRSGLPGPTRCSWPRNSSSVCGRIRSASGVCACRCFFVPAAGSNSPIARKENLAGVRSRKAPGWPPWPR